MNLFEKIKTLTKYKAWADELTFAAVSQLPDGEATKKRPTNFGNMLHTLNHVYVIDNIFKAHLTGGTHHYTDRNTKNHPSLEHLWQLQTEIDQWYVDYAESTSEQILSEIVNFKFVGGSDGAMSREDMIIHVVNHSSYHRGFVGDMMYQIPAIPPANDFPVFLRDAF